MAQSLEEIGIKLEQQAERIISGLKDRSRYPLNAETYMQQFHEGKTWFEYRLLKEQSLDAEFGRFDFEDQHPILFDTAEFHFVRKTRMPLRKNLVPVKYGISAEVINTYQRCISQICRPLEDEATYGETTKLDVQNVLTLYERICGLGSEVAARKLEENPELMYLDSETIIKKIRRIDIEEKRIATAIDLAKHYKIPKPNIIGDFFKEIIALTIKAELEYIQAAKKLEESKPKTPIGFGQTPRNNSEANRKGWGSLQ